MVNKRLALVIGNNYPNSDKELKFAVADALAMKEVLLNKHICGFDEVIALVDRTSKEASSAIEKILRKAENDLVFIYFSGHGKKDFESNLCLLFNDTNEDALFTTSLTFDFITKCMRYPSRKSVIIILDCCYSGAAGIRYEDTDVTEVLRKHSGSRTIILTSTGLTGFPTAKEEEKLGHGIFTYYLIEGLEKGYADKDGDGLISIDELYDYAYKKTKENSRQSPAKKGNIEGNIFIGMNHRLTTKEKEDELKKKRIFYFGDKFSSTKIDYEANLPEDLKELLEMVRASGNRITQRELRKKFPYSESKVSLMLSDLEERGLIEKFKRGKRNIVRIADKYISNHYDYPVTSTLYGVPTLPNDFVGRSEITENVKTWLLNPKTNGKNLAICVIQGVQGSGKSDNVAFLANRADVQEHFPDGVLWARLGHEPSILSLLTDWILALGDITFRPENIERASNYLRTQLMDKSALLVVDDAWSSSHVKPFIVGGPRCRLIITTRETSIATDLDATLFNLDKVSEEKAIRLLSDRLNKELKGKKKEQARILAQIVDNQPLALELAVAQIVDGVTWEELIKELTIKHGDIHRERSGLLNLLEFSLRRLPIEILRKFLLLGILPEDVEISPIVAATLWGQSENEAFYNLSYLSNKSLLLKSSDKDFPTFRMHDLVHSSAVNLITAPKEANIGQISGLGIKLEYAHAYLLERYRAKTRDGVWQTLPDDGYIHEHLLWHMEKAGWIDELQSVLHEISGFGTIWENTENLQILEYAAKEQIASDNYVEAKKILDKITYLSPEKGDLIKSQLGFLYDILDDNNKKASVYEDLLKWRKNVWCVLSDSNNFKLTKTEFTESNKPIDEELDSDKTPNKIEDKKPVEKESPQKIGNKLEEAAIKLFENDFIKIAEKEYGWELDYLRRQNCGTQNGHDIFFRYKIGNRYVTCLIECKNERDIITLEKLDAKLLQADKHNKDIDHWILISPNAQVSNDMEGKALGGYLLKLQKIYPFKIHVWDKTRNIKELFGLCYEAFDMLFKVKPEDHPKRWEEKKRLEIFRRWAEELKPWILLPNVWEEYVKDPSLILFKSERTRELQFEQLYNDYIPMKLMDERRNVLDEATEKHVKEWLGNKEIPILFLLGEFGDGKSSFTYILSRKLIEEFNINPSHSWIPIRFALREYSKFEYSKFDYPSQDFLKGRLEELGTDLKSFYKLMGSFKNVLIILDGFDEISKKLDRSSMERNRRYLVNCCEELKGLKVIITSRPHFIEDRDYKMRLFNGIKQVNGECCICYLAPVKREKATKYLEKRFKDKPGSKEKLQNVKKLQDPIDLLSKPLFIQMMDEIFDKLSDNKLTLVKLYNLYVEKSLDAKCEYLGYDDPKTNSYAVDFAKTKVSLEELLEHIAIELYNSEDDYISLKSISAEEELEIAEILWDISCESGQEYITKDATARVAIRSLLTRVYIEDENIEWPVEFCHRSMREFFVAKAIYRAISENLYKAKVLFRQLNESLNPEILYFISELIKENNEKICDNILKIITENKSTDYPLGKLITLLYQVKGELSGEDWCNMNLDYVDLTSANLTGKKFTQSTLRSSRLYNVNFEEADFTDCDLTDAKFGDTKPVLAVTPHPSRKKIIVTYGDSTITKGYNIIAEWDISNKLKPDYRVTGENKNGFINWVYTYSGDDLLAVTDDEIIFYDYNNNNKIVENSRFKIKKEVLRTIPKKENILVIEENEGFNKKINIIGLNRTLLYSEEIEDGTILENLDQNILALAKNDSLCLMNLKAKKNSGEIKLEASNITALSSFCIKQDEQYLLACGQKDGEVKVWRIDTLKDKIDYKLLLKDQLHEGIVTTLSFLDDSRIVSGGVDRKVHIVMFEDSGENLSGNLEFSLYSNIKCKGMKIKGLKSEKERKMLSELILQAEKS